MIWKTRQASDSPARLAVREAGSGPTLLLLHGVGLCSEAWNPLAEHLTEHFTLRAVDMPGHGGSPQNGATHLQDYVGRLRRLFEDMAGPVFVVGHSMGAMLALELAATAPQSVAGVAALNAIYRRTPDAAKAVQARAAALSVTGVSDPTPTLTRWFGDAPTGQDATAKTACHRWLTSVDPEGYKAAYTVFAHSDGPSDAALGALHCPALFLTGGQDPNSTPAMSRAMAEQAPNGHARIIQDAAHMLPMTHAAETARALITCFSGTAPARAPDPTSRQTPEEEP